MGVHASHNENNNDKHWLCVLKDILRMMSHVEIYVHNISSLIAQDKHFDRASMSMFQRCRNAFNCLAWECVKDNRLTAFPALVYCLTQLPEVSSVVLEPSTVISTVGLITMLVRLPYFWATNIHQLKY